MSFQDELRLEEEKILRLKMLADSVSIQIVSGSLSFKEAIALVEEAREEAKKIIPDMMDKYSMIYESRFQRLIWQFMSGASDHHAG